MCHHNRTLLLFPSLVTLKLTTAAQAGPSGKNQSVEYKIIYSLIIYNKL